MTYLEQLESWQKGISIHDEQCCPDFSCCRPELLAPQDVRDVFTAAYKQGQESVTMRFLMMFLGNTFTDKKIYIVGQEASKQELE